MMTHADISKLNYILGRLEGLACGAENDVQAGILDTCEMLAELIDKNEKGGNKPCLIMPRL